jgi:hypothetical protein
MPDLKAEPLIYDSEFETLYDRILNIAQSCLIALQFSIKRPHINTTCQSTTLHFMYNKNSILLGRQVSTFIR